MAIELHHLHPGHDDEVSRLKARIAELEHMDTEHTLQIAKMNGYISYLEEERRWRKFSEEKPQKYTWCLVSGKSLMGNYIVIMDFFEEDDWAENPSLYDDSLDIEWWMPPPSAPKEGK